MTGWIIFGAILLFFAVLLSLSVTFRVEYGDHLTLTVGAGKLRFTLVPASDKEKKDAKKSGRAIKKSLKKEQKEKNPKAKKKIEKGNIKEMVFLVLDILKSVLPPFKDLLKRVRITSLSIEITVGGEDAAETAVSYGKISALVYGGLATLRNLMPVKVDRVFINCDFLKERTEQKVFFKVKIRVLFVVWAALRMGGRLLVNTSRRAKKNAANKQKPSNESPEGAPAGKNRRN